MVAVGLSVSGGMALTLTAAPLGRDMLTPAYLGIAILLLTLADVRGSDMGLNIPVPHHIARGGPWRAAAAFGVIVGGGFARQRLGLWAGMLLVAASLSSASAAILVLVCYSVGRLSIIIPMLTSGSRAQMLARADRIHSALGTRSAGHCLTVTCIVGVVILIGAGGF